MKNLEIASGVVHEVPEDLKVVLFNNLDLMARWNSLTALSRNEWICWVTSVKKSETRKEHIERLATQILEGKRRPCCWPGCSHRLENEKDMPKDIETFIEIKVIEKYKPIVAKFRCLIKNEFPNIKEEMRGGTEKYYGVPVYRYNRIIITISPTKKGITFSFSNGKKFEDRYSLLEGEGNRTLNLRISNVDNYNDEILRYYINQAIEHDA